MQSATRKSDIFVLVRGVEGLNTRAIYFSVSRSGGSTVTPMDRREHRRVRMSLPVRLRWAAPLGQKIELCETFDASRNGLLVFTKPPHATGVPPPVACVQDGFCGWKTPWLSTFRRTACVCAVTANPSRGII